MRRLQRTSIRLYRLLLYAYPRSHRSRFAEPMACTFADMCTNEINGPVSTLRIWLTEYPVVLFRGLSRRLGLGGRSLRKRPRRRDHMSDGRLVGTVQDVVHGWRMLRRRPMFATVVITTLVLGIGMNTAIFSVLYGVLLQPLPFPDSDRLLRIGRASPGGPWLNPISPSEFLDLAPRLTLTERIAAISPTAQVLTDSDEPVLVRGGVITTGLFAVLGVQPQRGRFFTDEDSAPGAARVVVLSDSFWRNRLGGAADVVGSTVELGGVPYTVVGVGPKGFSFRPGSGLSGAEYWEPVIWTESALTSRHSHYLLLYGRLAPGATIDAASAELGSVWQDVIADDPGNHLDESYERGMVATSLREFAVGSSREPLLFLGAAVALVLAVACVNVANLLLANADARRHELAMRAALGAGRGRLMRQFVTEALVVTGIGGGLGVLLADGAVRGFFARYPDAVPRTGEIGLHLPVLAFAVGVSLLTALVLGLLATLQTDFGAGALQEQGRGHSGRVSWLRRGLVVAEIALALILVVGAGLLIKSFWAVQRVDMGFDPNNLVAVNLTLPRDAYSDREARASFYRELRERLLATPGIEAVGMTNMVPIRSFGNNVSGLSPTDDLTRRASYVELRYVTPSYHETLGIPLLRGRWFDEADTESDNLVVLINETLARELFGDESPIGRHLASEQEIGQDAEVVGVVGDIRAAGPDRDAAPHLYMPTAYASNLLIRGQRDPSRLLPQLRALAREIEPGARVYRAETMTAMLDDSLGGRRFQLTLLVLFAGVALALGAVGIYGVMAQMIEGKMRDFGIRLALGATAADVRLLVWRSAGVLAAGGLVAGLVGAYGLRRFIANLLFRVDPGDLVVYCGVALLMASVAALACWLPARRAGAADPVRMLRSE